MRLLLAVTLIVSSLCPQVFANKHDWEHVKRLKPATSVYVLLMKGQPVSGKFLGADDDRLRVATIYPWDNGVPEEIARENVRRIIHFRHRVLPNPQVMLVGGTLAGGTVGAVVGGIRDVSHGTNGRWVVDGIGGAGLGFLGACTTEAGFGIVALFRPDKVVYERGP